LAKTIALYVLPAILIASSWLRLEDGGQGARALALVVLALLPALATRSWLRLLVLLVVTAGAVRLAFSLWFFDMRPFDSGHDFFGPLFSRFGRGFSRFYDVSLPFDAGAQPEMAAVVLIAVFGFCLLLALAIAARRPIVSVLALAVGAGWPATILPGDSALATGGLLLAAVLLLLAIVRPRGTPALGQAVLAATMVVLAAIGASAWPAIAKGEFLEGWRRWDLRSAKEPAVGVDYVWESRYTGIRFPHKPTTVLRIAGPARSLYWRATVLDSFNGAGWTERLDWIDPLRNGDVDVLAADPSFPRAAGNRNDWIRQEVEIEALLDDHLVGASVPIAFQPPEPRVSYGRGGVAWYPDGVERGDRYLVWSYAPSPAPARLGASKPRYPAFVTGPNLRVTGYRLPPFGVPNRDARMRTFFATYGRDYRVQPYRRLYRQAYRVAGGARSPYAAAVALETWFRSQGGFVYDEQPPQQVSLPPLVYFLSSKRGYCQHFAGAMTLMLRYLGIPARVAAGFTSGKYDADSGVWTVTDRNAHAWVEVWFDGFGWLPFDPTPNRGALSASYTAASPNFDASAAAEVLSAIGGVVAASQLEAAAKRLNRVEGVGPGLLRAAERAGPGPSGGSGDDGGGARDNLLAALLIIALGLAAAIVAVKLAVRRIPFLTSDPRRLAAACRNELASFLADQGVEISRSATPGELARVLEEHYRVHGVHFARALAAARYGPPERAPQAARDARRELRVVRGALRRRLDSFSRVRGLVSLRSLAA
jgi:transglutaminase-like putative cysteine protease